MQAHLIWHCAKIWEQMGCEVQFLNGPEVPQNVDLVIPHVDMSVLSQEYRPLLDAEATVLNRRVTDIRKRSFSQNVVSIDDDYVGPVIVKTDCNAGGQPEMQVAKKLPKHKRLLHSMGDGLRALRLCADSRSTSKLAHTRLLSPKDYPVYQLKSDVPSCVFANPALMVEKYLPETDGRFYYTRCYDFCGDAGIAIRMKSESMVVKGYAGVEIEFVPVDERIEAIRRALGFDYGKFDYVVHNGEAVLLDINNTPTFGSAFAPDTQQRIASQVAKGITAWFPDLVR